MKSDTDCRVGQEGTRSFPRFRYALPGLGAALLVFGAGCSTADLRKPQRYEQGLIIVLPGIEGRSPLNTNIARGLAQGGVPSAIEIYDWTFAYGASWLVNLADESRNRHRAAEVARRIVAYQKCYPGKPVHLIGHSGGGGVAVFALEALPPDRPVTSALLLAPALSPDYDLRRALRRTKCGLWNFYSSQDFGFLKVGTTIFGTIDREHGSAAGAVGFHEPTGLGDEGAKLYRTRLHQVRYSERMARSGNSGGHTGWASRQFVREWLAPLLYSQMEVKPTYAVGVAGASGPAMGGGGGRSDSDPQTDAEARSSAAHEASEGSDRASLRPKRAISR
jgi:pimeloyl-ACP methyl ester carboxylesterase